MTIRLPSSGGEIAVVFLFGLGIATFLGLTVSAAVTAAQWLLDPATAENLATGLPWVVGGVLLGFVGGLLYAESGDIE